jgi:hypothetical protein
VLETLGVAQDVEHFKAADARHHNIRDNQVGHFLLGHRQSRFAIRCGDDVVTFCLQARFVNLAQVIVVFDKQNFSHSLLPLCNVKLMFDDIVTRSHSVLVNFLPVR